MIRSLIITVLTGFCNFAGHCSSGLVTLQSYYAPEFCTQSGGYAIPVELLD
ncbi:MAG: hypothetical protein ACO3M5_04065 [Saprospiraceae bacterium]